MAWRAAWEEVTNEHLAQAGLAVRIDHRSLKAQVSSSCPGRKIGVGLERQQMPTLPLRIAERVRSRKRIAYENGERILADPGVALKRSRTTRRPLRITTSRNSCHAHEGAEQFRAAQLKVSTSRELVTLGRDDRGRLRYTSREMLEVEEGMLHRAELMTLRQAHGVTDSRARAVVSQHPLSDEQRVAFEALTAAGDLKALVGVAGSGKSRLLAGAREAGRRRATPSRAQHSLVLPRKNLAHASGIASRTIASLEYAWQADRDGLTAHDVLVIDEAGMVGTRQLARVLEAAHEARAKVVLVGDPEQLQAIEAGPRFAASSPRVASQSSTRSGGSHTAGSARRRGS